METVIDFVLLGSKITADGDCNSHKDTNPIHKGSWLITSSIPYYLPKASPPNTIILRGGFSTYEFGGGDTQF